jgi:hypothetical protein
VATSPGGEMLWPEILAWGLDRARGQHARRGGDASLTISARADDGERIALLEAEGFERKQWVTVQHERALVCTENTRAGANALYSSVLGEMGVQTLSFSRAL